MKKFVIAIVILMASPLLRADEFYYYGGGERIYLYPCKDIISIKWQRDVRDSKKQTILNAIPGSISWYNITRHRYQLTILKLDEAKTQETIEELINYSEVAFAHALLCTKEKDTLILTNEIIVKLKPPLTIKDLQEKYGMQLIREDPYDDAYKVFEIPKYSQFNALDIANELTESGLVQYATPNFVRKIILHSDPNDTYYSNQWALPHMNIPDIWDYETGSSNLVVAVFDAGVDQDHPDLAPIIVTGWDEVQNDYDPQCDPGDAHGTCCAGIIAAITHNDEGVAGVAGGWGSSGGCKIMPIRIYDGSWWVSDDEIKHCFEWATDHGAKILSNSWSTGGTSQIDPIHDGIEYAVDHGCLVLFSSGNAYPPNQSVRYPANDPLCIAVGATNDNDQRWWYSCYGSALDIVAPSGDVELQGDIWTTDNVGNAGYYPTQCPDGSPDGNYMGNFGGTSGACPYVAGYAALIWSKNPTQSAEWVKNAIYSEAKDLGTSGWDQYYGFGRINFAGVTQPDNHIKRWWESEYIGDDIYNSTGAGQYVLQFADPYQWAEYHIKIENDGGIDDKIIVTAAEFGTGAWTTEYYDALSGGNDITSQITSSSGWQITLAVGEYREILVKVRPDGNMNGNIKKVELTSKSWSPFIEKVDMVYMDTQCNVLQPDNQIKNRNETVYIGNDIYNTTGQYQTKYQIARRMRPAVYHIKVENDGETWDIDWISGTGGDSHWTVQYFDALTGGNDITTSVVDGTYYVILSYPGAVDYLRVKVTPSYLVQEGEIKEVLVTSTAGYNAHKKDAVKARTQYWLKDDPTFITEAVGDDSTLYIFSLGNDEPSPILERRQGYLQLGSEGYQTIDYDSTELIYRLALDTKGSRCRIKWVYYHEEPDKLKLQFNVDDVLCYNNWIHPCEMLTEEVWLPDTALSDNEITIKVKKLRGTIAILSEIELYVEEIGESGQQGSESQFTGAFFVENITPNPAHEILKIKFHSPDERRVMVTLYDVAGRLVENIFDGRAQIGMNEVMITSRRLSAGVYFVRLETRDHKEIRKVTFLR